MIDYFTCTAGTLSLSACIDILSIFILHYNILLDSLYYAKIFMYLSF